MSRIEKITKALNRTDWNLFLKQKAWLAEQIAELEPSGYSATECPEEILNFMDAVQDAWWSDGFSDGIQPWMIRKGIRRHVVEFIADPHAVHGTVCKIGEYWFYFGGTTAEEEDPDEFLANADLDEVAEDICQVLKDFQTEMHAKDNIGRKCDWHGFIRPGGQSEGRCFRGSARNGARFISELAR